MVMLNVYFDETGHGDDPNTKYLGIVGCMQRAEDWIELEKEWANVLKTFGELPYFHMNEFAHSDGIFKGWKGDEERRRQLYGELWKLIHAAQPLVIGSFVKLKGYKSLFHKDFQQYLVDAYYFCYLQCLKLLIELILDVDSVPINTCTTIFDYKKGFMDNAGKMYNDIIQRYPRHKGKIPSPVFRDMRVILPLQVADIIAYESYKELEERDKGENRRAKRWGFIQLEKLIRAGIPDATYEFGHRLSTIPCHTEKDFMRYSALYSLFKEENSK